MGKSRSRVKVWKLREANFEIHENELLSLTKQLQDVCVGKAQVLKMQNSAGRASSEKRFERL